MQKRHNATREVGQAQHCLGGAWAELYRLVWWYVGHWSPVLLVCGIPIASVTLKLWQISGRSPMLGDNTACTPEVLGQSAFSLFFFAFELLHIVLGTVPIIDLVTQDKAAGHLSSVSP